MGTNLLDEYFDNTESRYLDLDNQITECVINDLKKQGSIISMMIALLILFYIIAFILER